MATIGENLVYRTIAFQDINIVDIVRSTTKIYFKIVNVFQIPFVTARNANDIMDLDHEIYVGRPGTEMRMAR